jgi:PKD repeat protein
MKHLFFLILTALILSGLAAVQRNYVLVEIGTSTSCTACPGGAMGAHDLLANNQPVAIVNHHHIASDPWSNVYSEARYTYYSMPGTPTAHFDGLNRVVGGSGTTSLYSIYQPRVQSRISVPAHYTLSATGSYNGSNYQINVTVVKAEADTNSNVVLHAAVTESHLPYTWYNQTTVENVNRTMIPSYLGTAVNLATGAQTTIAMNYTMNPSWNAHNCEMVLWLQNRLTKEVLQTVKYPFDFLYKNFSATPTSGTTPLDVQFTTTVQAAGITLDWDFDNDGTFDSSDPSPIHTYTEPGAYSVRLRLTYGSSQDQIVKTNYITISAPPAPSIPQNTQISVTAANATLSWDPVTQDIHGAPLTITRYDIYYADLPTSGAGGYQFLGSTTQTTFTDPVSALTGSRRFYRIVAIR